MGDDRISRERRVQLAARYLQPGEPLVDHGLALWEEIERMFGRGGGTGFLAVTDRRLLFIGERRRMPTSIGFTTIKSHMVKKKLATCDLRLNLADGQTATFNGGKSFFGAVSDALNASHTPPANAETNLICRGPGHDMHCLDCHTTVTARWPNCPGCYRSIDWDSTMTKHAVELATPRI